MNIKDHPGFLAFRASTKEVSKPVEKVTVKEEGKADTVEVSSDEDKK